MENKKPTPYDFAMYRNKYDGVHRVIDEMTEEADTLEELAQRGVDDEKYYPSIIKFTVALELRKWVDRLINC